MILVVLVLLLESLQAADSIRTVKDLKIRILSTMLTDSVGVGEWGFAALVEGDGHRILFDTGSRPDTVFKNANEMKVDLASITDVILSHSHGDHTGGLTLLRREFRKSNPKALSKAYVATGAFWKRQSPDGSEGNALLVAKKEYESLGGTFVEYASLKELFPGAYLTGPVKRVHPEKNFSTRFPMILPHGHTAEDNLPEDSSLVFNTKNGLVVLAGCGHAGIINTLEQARREVRNAPIHAAIGGWHLFNATDEHLEWTASKLKEFQLQQFLGAHCTGIEAVYRIRQLTGLNRRQCAVGAVGGGFTLNEGLQPGAISR